MDLQVGGLFGLLILAIDVWAIVTIVQSGAATAQKVLWIVLILLLPVVGVILWFLLGPRSARA
ncbi:MAG TPA: PLDc N-terminal domain-containing protein [Burkholderiales bacterium]|nr:PLDc N-terminal domain-containing protein [Burkholderiales bacterium]